MRAVVIGASYGGLYATMELLGSLTTDFPCPIVIAQHRSAEDLDEHRLGAVLSRYSALPVSDANHGGELEPSHVYLAPADYHLLIEGGRFELTVDAVVEHSRPSIDVLFESAARSYGGDLVAVLLTGYGRDGTAGMRTIHDAGGITIAEDPETALEPTMPRNAINAGVVDEVLTLDEIPGRLLELSGVTA